MDRKLREVLTECIRDIETGARDVEGCLQRHPQWAADLRPHLELWSSLNAAAKAEPSLGGQQRGQQRLEAAVSEAEREGGRRMIPFLTPALAKVGAVAVAAVLVIGGTAGGSAALGGPDVADEVLTTVGITDDDGSHDDVDDDDVSDSDDGSVDDAGDDIYETPEAESEQEQERERERDSSSDDSDDTGDDTYETPEANREQEMERDSSSQDSSGAGESTYETPEANGEQQMQTEQTTEKEQEMERASEGSGSADDTGGNTEGQGG